MGCKTDEKNKILPIPPRDAPGLRFLRDGFTAAYLFDEGENRLFLLDPRGTMSEICSRDMRDVVLAFVDDISDSQGDPVRVADRTQIERLAA